MVSLLYQILPFWAKIGKIKAKDLFSVAIVFFCPFFGQRKDQRNWLAGCALEKIRLVGANYGLVLEFC
jgi:hypothetical protein